MEKPYSSDTATLTILSKCTIFPSQKSTLGNLKLSISDLNMLCSHYIQKGLLFTTPTLPSQTLIPHLTSSLSKTLSLFPPLAGRLITDSNGYIYITCNDAGADLIHASATQLSISNLLSPPDVPQFFKQLFPFHHKISHIAHFNPILAVQLTELADGIFIGCAVCHTVTDGTSFWNFFNTFAEISKGVINGVTNTIVPNFRRESILISDAVLQLKTGDMKVTFNGDEPMRERIFSFSSEVIKKLKARVNERKESVERLETVEISSFQSLCALMWRCVTRARNIDGSKTTTFRMAVNVRNRLGLKECYFGNAIQSFATCAPACEVLGNDLTWSAEKLNKSVRAYDSAAVRRAVENWEREPKIFELGNHDGATLQMGSSPRFPMYENDFGWGRPVAVRSGAANKFDGKMSAFPGSKGGGSVDLEVVLAPDTMARLESDPEFMFFVSG